MMSMLVLAHLPTAAAQFSRRAPTPNDALQSTQIQSDNRVTFRVYAPKASEVSISGDWMAQGLGGGGNLDMDDQGVWSITVGPLPPDLYSYSFNVDGVKTLDPKNPLIKQGISSVDNMFFLPGPEAAFEDCQAVPHGVIHQVWYSSNTLETQRRMHVYTPPGYEKGTERYPVLYLLHGGGDEDSGWSTIGRAGWILDNLLASQSASSMIIVMPNGSLPRPQNLTRRATSEEGPPPDFRAIMETLQNRFTNELLQDVIPTTEKMFRVRPGAENRALAGLSMGGGQTLRVLTMHPEQFGYVGIWSAGLFGGNAEQWEQQNQQFLDAADEVNRALQHLEIVVGDQDFAMNGAKALSDILKKHEMKHDLRITSGGHTWINWRMYLHDFCPQLFGHAKTAESTDSVAPSRGLAGSWTTEFETQIGVQQ
jgi:enterochelin esterase family protein